MENVSVVGSASFVKPHFIKELGCDGLTLHEMAHSLGVGFSKVKAKFSRMLSSGAVEGLYMEHHITYGNGRPMKTYLLSESVANNIIDSWASPCRKPPSTFYIVEFASGVKVGIGSRSRTLCYDKPWCQEIIDKVVLECADPRALETHLRRKFALSASLSSPEFFVGVCYEEVMEEVKRVLGKFNRVEG